MARIRSVKPAFFRHRRLFIAEHETGLPLRIAFAGLWTVCDREGRFEWEPEEIKLDCLPYDDVDFSRVLDALTTRGFVVRYASQGREYGWVPGFTKHQVINNRESPSQIPPPPENGGNTDDLTRDPRVDNASTTRHDPAQAEGKGKEEEGNIPPPPLETCEDGDDGDWASRLSDHDRALVLVWRATGSHDDQIRQWLTTTRGPHRERIAAWIRDGIPASRLPGVVVDILDRLEGSDGTLRAGGKPINDVWAYLGKAVPATWGRIHSTEATAEARIEGMPPPEPWLARYRGFRTKNIWLDAWGPKPGEPGCRVPADVQQEFLKLTN